ncbi:hypothetical protein DB721_05335 [Helicobacter pylori]|uniref:Uncharacterized protein n=1 Tax=Helicobacter pylori TaxID=210 RepID=A0A7Z6SSP0_HELPX|nr:hypothetical protein DB721_05335 [Helicobacter pylori]
MGAILSILKLEIKSYLTNTSALFWTFIYPILMLLLLIFVFSKNTTEIFYFNNIIGLMGLLIICIIYSCSTCYHQQLSNK